MRYIVKPKNKISAETRKKPSRPRGGASSHPLRTEVSLRNVKNLSRTKNRDRRKEEVCCFTQTRVQTPGQHFLNSTQISQAVSNPISAIMSITTNQVTTKTNIRNVESNLKSSYNMKYNLSLRVFTQFSPNVTDLIVVRYKI